MKKSDLKTGMVVELSTGARGKVLLGTEKGDIIAGNYGDEFHSNTEGTWCLLDEYDENLVSKSNSKHTNINKVYAIANPRQGASISSTGDLLWERNSHQAGWYGDSEEGNEKWLMYYNGLEFVMGFNALGIWTDELEKDGPISDSEYLAHKDYIEERLNEEAKRRGYKPGAIYQPDNKKHKPRAIINEEFELTPNWLKNIDALADRNYVIFDTKAGWREIVNPDEYQWLVKFKGEDTYQVTHHHYTSTQDVFENAEVAEVVKRIEETKRSRHVI